MGSRRSPPRGAALIMAVIVVLLITIAGVAVLRFASREVAGSTSGRQEASAAICAEAAQAYLMSQWKLLGTHDVHLPPMNVVLERTTPTVLRGGHFGQDPTDSKYWDSGRGVWLDNVQVRPMDPQMLGPKQSVSDISNRIGDTVIPYRVTVHCTQGTPPDAREVEVDFGVAYGL